jgi:hypothetical protein
MQQTFQQIFCSKSLYQYIRPFLTKICNDFFDSNIHLHPIITRRIGSLGTGSTFILRGQKSDNLSIQKFIHMATFFRLQSSQPSGFIFGEFYHLSCSKCKKAWFGLINFALDRMGSGEISKNLRVIPCQLDKLMSPWVENFKIDIFHGFCI